METERTNELRTPNQNSGRGLAKNTHSKMARNAKQITLMIEKIPPITDDKLKDLKEYMVVIVSLIDSEFHGEN